MRAFFCGLPEPETAAASVPKTFWKAAGALAAQLVAVADEQGAA